MTKKGWFDRNLDQARETMEAKQTESRQRSAILLGAEDTFIKDEQRRASGAERMPNPNTYWWGSFILGMIALVMAWLFQNTIFIIMGLVFMAYCAVLGGLMTRKFYHDRRKGSP